MTEGQLPRRFSVEGLHIGDYVVDLEISHGLRPGVLLDEDRPEVVSISRLARIDGQPLGNKPISLNLKAAAIDAVIKGGCRLVMVRSTDDPSLYVGGNQPNWRQAALLVRRLASDFGGFRWSKETDDWLVEVWRHFQEDHDPETRATQKDLADALGLDVNIVRDRLRRLRKSRGVERVPEGRRGRPVSRERKA
jgi:hypothetical protein